MGYAIAGLYVVVAGLYAILAPILHHLLTLTNRMAKMESRMEKIEDKIDILTATETDVKKIAGAIEEKVEKKELEEVKRRLEIVEKKLSGTPA